MFEYLRLRESFATMFFIIWGMMAKLGSFVVILMIVLLAFTSLDFVAFGSSRGRSQAFLSSLISRFQGSLGDVDFESAASLDHDWGMAFLIFFIFVAVLLLLNLLIAVMSEAYEEVKEVAEAGGRTCKWKCWWSMRRRGPVARRVAVPVGAAAVGSRGTTN
jgi:hypothetical protein